MYKLLDLVKVTKDFPEDGIKAGAIGTVIECYAEPSEGYEVEFLDDEGYTIAVLTLDAVDVDGIRA